MSGEDWTFPEEPWYEMGYSVVKFVAICGENRYVCAISTSAINDALRTADTCEAALENYKANPGPWHAAGVHLIQNGLIHPAGFYLITSEVAREFGLLA